MGMPSTKAECNAAIERKKGQLAKAKLDLAAAKKDKTRSVSSYEYGVKKLTDELANLKAHKATLKK